MTTNHTDAVSPRAAPLLTRLVRAWRSLGRERRGAAIAATLLFVTLFLPWYSVSVSSTKLRTPTTQTFSGWGAFSFVEAAVLLVALSVLMLLFQRAEGRAFHLPGGDGTIITLAGAWTCFLVIWRMFDKQGVASHGQLELASGIRFGIGAALAAAAGLTYSGSRIRAAHVPEPPLPTEGGAVFDGRWSEPIRASASGRDRRAEATAATTPLRDPADTRPSSRPRRSAWRPAERPEWSEPDRRTGWLTADLHERGQGGDAPTRRTPEPPASPSDQLTIRFDDDGQD